ncbi:hypothetical protein KKE60_06025 [Patescibacteria group bacterium]|nr:hypothetical protein [Patescibacteria group bacterium]
MSKRILEDKTLYDYYGSGRSSGHIYLSYTKKKIDVVLMGDDMIITFMDMGDKGLLTGKAYIDYIQLKESEDDF